MATLSKKEFREYATIATNIWFWTVMLKIVIPRVHDNFGAIAGVLTAFMVASLLILIYNKEGEIISNNRGTIVFFIAGLIAFIASFISFDPASTSALAAIFAVLMSVGLAILNGVVIKRTKLFMRVLSLGLVITSTALLSII